MTIIRDVATLFGFISVMYGLYRAWEPAAWIVGGGIVLLLSVYSRMVEQRHGRRG